MVSWSYQKVPIADVQKPSLTFFLQFILKSSAEWFTEGLECVPLEAVDITGASRHNPATMLLLWRPITQLAAVHVCLPLLPFSL